jgi:DNA-binding response OmpR family regulator
MTDPDPPVVLVVEDEPDLPELYERWLPSDYEMRVATNGQEAFERLDGTTDVVLLDRMMPGMSGSEVLAEIRERGFDCRVAMVTAVDPDFDIIEMGFDEYVKKPLDEEELRDTVERLLARSTLDDEFQEYYSLVSKRAALRAELSDEELRTSHEYPELIERIETHRDVVHEALGDLSSDTGFVGAVREITDVNPHANVSVSCRDTDLDDASG